MKALSIKQPCVQEILHEGKDIENRHWKRSFRGYIALHASAKPQRRPTETSSPRAAPNGWRNPSAPTRISDGYSPTLDGSRSPFPVKTCLDFGTSLLAFFGQ
jgi:hypothetical protein